MLFLDALSNLERVKTMKTTQRSSRRRAGLALLATAVLMAALAVAAALSFRAGDPPPDATNAIQEAPVSSENGNETNHADGAPSGEPQHELVQGADAKKVKTWIDSLNQAEAQYELAHDPDEIARLQRLAQELKQEWASFDPNTRIAIHMAILYGNAGRPSNPKILELLERDARTFVEEGADDDEEIAGRLSVRLDMYQLRSTKELNSIYQHMLNEKQGIVETHGWKDDPNRTEKQNRINKYFFEHTEKGYIPEGEKTPRALIEILVEGMDDLTAAKYLIQEPYVFPGVENEFWRREEEYAAEYAERALANDPSSRDALLVKMFTSAGIDKIETARLLIEHHPTDDDAVGYSVDELYEEYPEEAISAILRILPEDGLDSSLRTHMTLGGAYERLDMLYEAAEQYQIAFAGGAIIGGDGHFSKLERGERNYPSIWEERAAAAAEASKQPPSNETSETPPQRQPDAPRGVEPPPPPPNLEAEMSAAYADFAKAYQSAFEMEYALSEATPEGYMNALLGMARAFAKAGDAQHAQDAYNAVRKRHSREEVEQVFRRFDEQERLKRQPPNEEENDDSGEEE